MSEKVPQPRHENPGGNVSPTGDQKESKSQPFEVEMKRSREHLNEVFDTLFRTQMGGTYANRDEEGFSGDAASLYVLTSLKNEKGEDIPELVKVGWGEFSKQTFEGDKYPAFRDFPLDMYCVSQKDSYFADNKLNKEMTQNPKRYLSEHSMFVASQGKVQRAETTDHGRTYRLDKDIQATPYEETLRTVRNEIIKQRATPEEFAGFLQALPDDLSELGRYMNHLEKRVGNLSNRELQYADEQTKTEVRKKDLMHLLWGMGIETVGIAVGDPR
ncbi:MAG TPA: hypothetical protein VJA22_01915, partial [Patescibacteria group bacterium]|nr:hypothetical protein [Patescibacteria group bacterium]